MSQAKKLACCLFILAFGIFEAAKAVIAQCEKAAENGDPLALDILEKCVEVGKKARTELENLLNQTA